MPQGQEKIVDARFGFVMDDAVLDPRGDFTLHHGEVDAEIREHGSQYSGVANGPGPGIEEKTFFGERIDEPPALRRLLEDKELMPAAEDIGPGGKAGNSRAGHNDPFLPSHHDNPHNARLLFQTAMTAP